MSTLLQQLQSLGGRSATEKKAFRKQPSLLFDDKVAANVSLEQFYEIGKRGLCDLIQLSSNFASFGNTLFHEKFMQKDREVCSRAYNDALDESIRVFLTLLSPYFLETGAQCCIEYLLHVYKIHEYDYDALFECVLPYHEHILFIRVIQLIPLHKMPLWSFLKANIDSGTPVDRTLLVDKALVNINVLLVASKIIQDSEKHGCESNIALSFWTILATGLIERRIMSEAHLHTIITLVRQGLLSKNIDWLGSSVLIIVSFSNHITMPEDILVDFTESLCLSFRAHMQEDITAAKNDISMHTKTLFHALIYMLGSPNVSTLLVSIQSTWWNDIPWLASSQLDSAIRHFLKDEILEQQGTASLFYRVMSRMVSDSTLNDVRSRSVIDAMIHDDLIDVSDQSKEWHFLRKLMQMCLERLRQRTESGEPVDALSDHSDFVFLKKLESRDVQGFRYQMKLISRTAYETYHLLNGYMTMKESTISSPLEPTRANGDEKVDDVSKQKIAPFEEIFGPNFAEMSFEQVLTVLKNQLDHVRVLTKRGAEKVGGQDLGELLARQMRRKLSNLTDRLSDLTLSSSQRASSIAYFTESFCILLKALNGSTANNVLINIENLSTAIRLASFLQVLGAEDGEAVSTALTGACFSRESIKLIIADLSEDNILEATRYIFPDGLVRLRAMLQENAIPTLQVLLSSDIVPACFLFAQFSVGSILVQNSEALNFVIEKLASCVMRNIVEESNLCDYSEKSWATLLAFEGDVPEATVCAAALARLIVLPGLKRSQVTSNVSHLIRVLYGTSSKQDLLTHVLRLSIAHQGSLPYVLQEGTILEITDLEQIEVVTHKMLQFCLANQHALTNASWKKLLPVLLILIGKLLRKQALSKTLCKDLRVLFDGNCESSVLTGICAYACHLGPSMKSLPELSVDDANRFLRLIENLLSDLCALLSSNNAAQCDVSLVIEEMYGILRTAVQFMTGKSSFISFLMDSSIGGQKSPLSKLLYETALFISSELTVARVPSEIMAHLVLSDVSSDKSMFLVVQKVIDYVLAHKIRQGQIQLNEFQDLSVNQIVLLLFQKIFTRCSVSGLPKGLEREVIKLLPHLEVPSRRIEDISQTSTRDLSLTSLWHVHSEPFFELLYSALQQGFKASSLNANDVTVLQIFKEWVSSVPMDAGRSSKAEKFTKFAELFEEELLRLHDGKWKIEDSYDLHCAELILCSLREMNSFKSDSYRILEGIYLRLAVSPRIERLVFDILRKKWSVTLESSENQDAFDFESTVSAIDCRAKTYEILQSGFICKLQPLNDAMHLLGKIFGIAETSKAQEVTSIASRTIGGILSVHEFPRSALHCIVLMVLRFSYETQDSIGILSQLRQCLMLYNCEEIAGATLDLVQYADSIFISKRAKGVKRDHTDKKKDSQRFGDYVMDFCRGFLRFKDREVTHSKLHPSEITLVALLCDRVHEKRIDRDEMLLFFENQFSSVALLQSFDELFSLCSLSSFCNLLQSFVQRHPPNTRAGIVHINQVINVILDRFHSISSRRHQEYIALVRLLSVLLQLSDSTLTISVDAGAEVSGDIFPGLSMVLQHLEKQDIGESDLTSELASAEKSRQILDLLDTASRVLILCGADAQQHIICAVAGKLISLQIFKIFQNSSSDVLTYCSILRKVFDCDKTAVAMLTAPIYTQVLLILASSGVDSTKDTLVIDEVLQKLDSHKAFEAFHTISSTEMSSPSKGDFDLLFKVSTLAQRTLAEKRSRRSVALTYIKDLISLSTSVSNVKKTAESHISFLKHASDSAAEITLHFFLHQGKDQIIAFMNSLMGMCEGIGEVDAGVQFDRLVCVVRIMSAITHALLVSLGESLVDHFPALEKIITSQFKFIAAFEESPGVRQALLDLSTGKIPDPRSQEEKYSKLQLQIFMLRESIMTSATAVGNFASIPSGQGLIQRSEKGENGLVTQLVRIMCDPLWQHGAAPHFFRSLAAKEQREALGLDLAEFMMKCIDTAMIDPSDPMLEVWQKTQGELLRTCSNQHIADIVLDAKARTQVSVAIRCRGIALIEAVYRRSGHVMNALLRDTLDFFSILIEDVNPVIKAYARKALQTVVSATGQSAEDIFSVLRHN